MAGSSRQRAQRNKSQLTVADSCDPANEKSAASQYRTALVSPRVLLAALSVVLALDLALAALCTVLRPHVLTGGLPQLKCRPGVLSGGHRHEYNLAICQNEDPQIKILREKLEKNEDTYFETRNGIIYRKKDSRLLFYVPASMDNNGMYKYYDEMGHYSVEKTIHTLILRNYWFPNLKTKIEKHIKNCLKKSFRLKENTSRIRHSRQTIPSEHRRAVCITTSIPLNPRGKKFSNISKLKGNMLIAGKR
ncbi:hypothetical protein ALC57_05856 [Trachymyrmex cornetzi]|uniref:Integrase zinc-binding domain-containing protein n=1 Tax=Trachymyrmex cornetzi TaxID=471704 RepID=A0A151J9K8_9HYME|nr:hypothetical protein ALC57_05856 [Trachymyrmex cornetzi]